MRTATKRILGCGLALAAAIGSLFPAASSAQAYPTKPIRFIQFLAAGGTADAYYRILADGLSQGLGQPVIVENKPGAGGVLAFDLLQKTPPDGYTIGSSGQAALVVLPLLQQVPFDPLKSFTHMGVVWDIPLVLAVNSQSKINSVQELLAFARANPGKLNYGSNGMGTAPNLAMEWFKILTNTNIVHIPFKDDVGIIQGLRNNEVHVTVYGAATLLPLQKQGFVKMLASLGPGRDSDIPDVPSAKEVGMPEFLVPSMAGMMGPAGIPRDIVEKINRIVVTYAEKPEVLAKLKQTGYKPRFTTPEENVQALQKQIATFRDVIEKAKIKIN